MEQEGNAYLMARKKAGLTREQASELLGNSPSTQANYELGVTKTIPPDAVVMMSDLFNAPELKYHYCANECPIGRGMPIPSGCGRIEPISVKAIRLLSGEPAEEATDKILEILSDGRLTEENLTTITWLIKYMDSLSRTLFELRLAYHKMMAEGGINDKRL